MKLPPPCRAIPFAWQVKAQNLMSTVITAVDPANCCGVRVKLFSAPTEGNMSVQTLENRFVALLRISALWNQHADFKRTLYDYSHDKKCCIFF